MRTLLLLAIFLSSAANADDYDVQIGAFRNPDPAKIRLPANVGELRSTAGTDGLTRFVVGPFASKTEAERARDELRAAGFPGAFVRTTGDLVAASAQSAPTPVAPLPAAEPTSVQDSNEASSISQSDIDTLLSLSDEERRDLVYLDGRLHKKVGDEFIPLRD